MAFNNLSDAEIELLDVLAEECAEVIIEISKIKRHGLHSYHPDDKTKTPNRDRLHKELGDVMAATRMLESANIINMAKLPDYARAKLKKIPFYLHHAVDIALNTFIA